MAPVILSLRITCGVRGQLQACPSSGRLPTLKDPPVPTETRAG